MAAGVVNPSRQVIVRALAIVAALAYLAAAAILMAAVEPLGLAYEWAARLLGVFGATFAAMMLMPPGRARSWLKLQLAKHLFRHRYDYREEWLRFTRRLGDVRPGEELSVRIAQAFADIVETPDARLLIAGASGRLEPAGAGEWPAGAAQGAAADFARLIERDQRILDGDALRGPAPSLAASTEERALAPRWLVADDGIWAGVPLVHGERLAGLVLLGHPPVRRRLD